MAAANAQRAPDENMRTLWALRRWIKRPVLPQYPAFVAHKQPIRKTERYRDEATGRFVSNDEGALREHIDPDGIVRNRVIKKVS